MGARLAFPATKNNSVEIAYISNKNLRYTFDKSAEEINGKVLVPSSLVKACDFLGFIELFFQTLHDNLPVVRAKQLGRSLRVRGLQCYPARRPRCLGKKNFFCPISGTEFDHFWNWFGKNKFPVALQLLK